MYTPRIEVYHKNNILEIELELPVKLIRLQFIIRVKNTCQGIQKRI